MRRRLLAAAAALALLGCDDDAPAPPAPKENAAPDFSHYDLAITEEDPNGPPVLGVVRPVVHLKPGQTTGVAPYFDAPTDPDGDAIAQIAVEYAGDGVVLFESRMLGPGQKVVIEDLARVAGLRYVAPTKAGRGVVRLTATDAKGLAGKTAEVVMMTTAPAPRPAAPQVERPPPPPPPPPPDLKAVLAAMAARDFARLRSGSPVASVAPTVEEAPETEPVYSTSDPNYAKLKLRADPSTYPVDRRRMITAFRTIPAILEEVVQSEVGGRIKFWVPRPIYGDDGRLQLMPAGTRVMCIYEQLAAEGDSRLPVQCVRVMRPDGASVVLTNAYGGDATGAHGMVGDIDNRIFEKYGASFILASISAITAFATGGGPDSRGAAASATFAENLSETSKMVLDEKLDLAPVMRIAKGSSVTLIPMQDIVFPPAAVVAHQAVEVGEK